jgi:hypothetical protein
MSRFLWTLKEDFGPSPRAAHAMAFDSNRGRVVLFGGNPYAGSILGDTWEWDGEFWTQISDVGPSPRSYHAMAFDSTRKVVLLFGGIGIAGTNVVADTWSWDGTDWTQLADTGPAGRESHSLAFDTVRGRAVLFGGLAVAGLVNDTWEWDGQQWTEQENIGPSARWGHGMVYDLVGGHTVLFGGVDGNQQVLADTWEWDGALWTQTANFGPNPCYDGALASTDVQVALYGGASSDIEPPAPTLFPDTWSYTGNLWTHRQDIGPGPRYGHAMAFDTARRTIVLFGGLAVFNPPVNSVPAGQVLGDTWEHTETDPPASAPTQNQPSGSPPVVTTFVLAPSSGIPLQPVTATLTLDQPAPSGDTVVQLAYQSLSDSNAAATPLGQFTVVAGATSGQFTFPIPRQQGSLKIVALSNTQEPMASAMLTIQ